MTAATWLIEGRDPLIFRDGRPIGGDAPIATLPFPLPSTIAGAVRGRLATDPKTGNFTLRGDDSALAELLTIPVHGPLLAELQRDGQHASWLFPAPRDALVRVHEHGGDLSIARLLPRTLGPGEQIDALAEHSLRPLFPDPDLERSKPPSDPVAFWNDRAFETWLMGHRPTVRSADDLGIRAFPKEPRMHVSMRPGERVAEDGALFETVGLRLAHAPPSKQRLSEARHFALSFRTPGGVVRGRPLQLHRGLAPIGGERRLARWSDTSAPWPAPPAGLREAVLATCRARLLLITPAIFGGGALPAWSGCPWPTLPELRVTVEAAAVPPAEVVSGWDLNAKKDPKGRPRGAPKPTRRMAPAGSVYFVRLDGPEPLRRAWFESTWLHSISDKDQDRLDGFGLTAIGTWSE